MNEWVNRNSMIISPKKRLPEHPEYPLPDTRGLTLEFLATSRDAALGPGS